MMIEGVSPNTPKAVLRTRILQNTIALLGGRGINVLVGAGTSVLLARYLGSEQFGQFGALYAYLSLFFWLASLGIEPVLVREASRQRGMASSILLTGAVLCALSSLATAALAVLLAPHVGYAGKMQILVLFGAIDILALVPLRLSGVIFQVDLKQWYGVGVNVARQVSWLGVVVVLALLKAPLSSFIIGRLAGALFEVALILVFSSKVLLEPRRILGDQLVPYLRASAPIALSSLLASVYLRIDQVMLHNLASDRVLGNYVAAVKVSELFEMVPAALLSSLFPVLAAMVSREARWQGYVERIFRYMMVVAGGLAVCVSVGASSVVGLLYGREFAPAARLLTILIWSEFAIFFGSVVVNVLLAGNLQEFLIFPTAVGAGVNVLLNLVLIPRHGAEGAAWATLASYTLAWMISLLAFSRTRPIVWLGLRCSIRIIGMSAAASLVAIHLPIPVVPRVASALFFFVVGNWGLRTIHREDLEYLRGAVNRGLWRTG